MSVLVVPQLPAGCGPISSAVVRHIAQEDPHRIVERLPVSLEGADPYGLDVHRALCVCYELHYRGFASINPRWEWDGGLLDLRVQLEDLFLSAIRRDIGLIENPSAQGEMAALELEPAVEQGLSYFLRDHGTWSQMQEYFIFRSLYHLKEGDPHAWAIPRLTGQAKASFVAVEFDEFGAGRGVRVHQQLFADLLRSAGLDSSYLGYLVKVPAAALVPVNMMSMFGLRRELRGAAVGHFAATEITSPRGSQHIVDGLRRLAAPEACVRFYAEHVEADAVHEQVVRAGVVADLLTTEPDLEKDIVLGIRAFNLVEDRLADYLMDCWSSGASACAAAAEDLF